MFPQFVSIFALIAVFVLYRCYIYQLKQNADVEVARFPNDFEWGLASAPAHTEEHLDDLWMRWANASMIPHFFTVPNPHLRLQFWGKPQRELDLVQNIGVGAMRFAVDWGRLVPHMPGSLNCDKKGYVTQRNARYSCRDGVQDIQALDRYVEIIQMLRVRNLKVWLTLFHHSLPRWSEQLTPVTGWVNAVMIQYFVSFASDVVQRTHSYIHKYVTFNEPAVFGNLVYGINYWPGRMHEGVDPLAYWNTGKLQGDVIKAFDNMFEAHRQIYRIIHSIDSSAQVGISKNIAHYVSVNAFAVPLMNFMKYVLNNYLMDKMAPYMDFIGVNYYGKEMVSVTGLGIIDKIEYSESGRAVSPSGLYTELQTVHEKWNLALNRSIPIFITENGISDDSDILRPAYIIEHLVVLSRLIEEGVPIMGYHHWTISDNIEWADGYCPKFGLYKVLRDQQVEDGFGREARHTSVQIYRNVVKANVILHRQRLEVWNLVKNHAQARDDGQDDFSTSQRGTRRKFCRTQDGQGVPEGFLFRRIQALDWRVDYKLHLFGYFWWPCVTKDRE